MRATIVLALVLLAIPAYVLAGNTPSVSVPDPPAMAVFEPQSQGGIVPAFADTKGSANGAEILLAKNGRHHGFRGHRGFRGHHGFRGRHFGYRHFRGNNHFGFRAFTPFYGSYYNPYYRSYGYPYYSSSCYGYSPYYGYYRYPYGYGTCY
ncbi:MAG: hypothetical protein AB9873_08545 [Syntrophobacteraceae bacterium]